MTERVPCMTPGCAGTILPSTAETTGGHCMPCRNRTVAAERERAVAAQRVDVDLFAGVSDVVEILRLLHQPPAHDSAKRFLPPGTSTADVYRRLGQLDADRLVVAASKDAGFLRDVAVYLPAFSHCDLSPLQRALLATGDPYPAAAFRMASPAIVDRLFTLLEAKIASDDGLGLDHALCALAWARSPRVVDTLVDWSRRRPSWSALLHIAPHEYATVAGYAVDEGGPRDLIVDSPVRLVAAPGDAASAPAVVFEPATDGGACPHCAQPAVSLLSLHSGALPAHIRALVPERAPTCPACACYGPLFVQIAANGNWRWLPTERARAAPLARWNFAPVRATFGPRGMWEAVSWCVADGLSQIGGHPSWINDPLYPPCPVCARRMATVAQVGLDDFHRRADGIFYVHHCPGCSIVGVSHDQS